MVYQVDLNCDMGESFGRYKLSEQKEILTYVSSANIACGFHAGDPTVMRETVQLALENGVKVGAHPGLPDLIGFGRREMAITAQQAYDMVVYQIGALHAFLTTYNAQMQHVKPHGALYNMAAKDKELAAAIAQAVNDFSTNLVLYALSGSELAKAGEKIGLTTAHEVFADRTYQSDGSLTSRNENNAFITNREQAVSQVIRMVTESKVISTQKNAVPLKADTICIHGDGKHALEFATYITDAFQKHNIRISPV